MSSRRAALRLFGWLAIAATLVAPEVAAQPTTMPATRPSAMFSPPPRDAWPDLIAALGDRDPRAREGAREALMLLSPDDLPALRDAARGRVPLGPARLAALRDVVVHVHLTGQHGFAGGGSGYLGIDGMSSVRLVDDDGAATPSTVVRRRIVGYDGFRALRVGDVITAVLRPGASPYDVDAEEGFVNVINVEQLRAQLNRTRPGDWVALRIVRDGAECRVRIRVGRAPPRDEANRALPPDESEGRRYWSTEFEPAVAGVRKAE